MFFRSLFWERTVLSLLEKVRKLPPSVQADIAKRVGDCIQIASAAREAARRGSIPHWTSVGPRPHLSRPGAWLNWRFTMIA